MARFISKEQFDQEHGGGHVPLLCEDHPHLRWSCKKLSTSPDKEGVWRYNGMRHIFFDLYHEAKEPECSCSAGKLRVAFEEEKEQDYETVR